MPGMPPYTRGPSLHSERIYLFINVGFPREIFIKSISTDATLNKRRIQS